MPTLRRLSGLDVLDILAQFGFEVIRIKGSHYVLRRTLDTGRQTLTVPVHGKQPLATGTLRAIYRAASQYVPEEDLKPHFYSD